MVCSTIQRKCPKKGAGALGQRNKIKGLAAEGLNCFSYEWFLSDFCYGNTDLFINIALTFGGSILSESSKRWKGREFKVAEDTSILAPNKVTCMHHPFISPSTFSVSLVFMALSPNSSRLVLCTLKP